MPEIQSEYCKDLASRVSAAIEVSWDYLDVSVIDLNLVREWREKCVVKPGEFEDWKKNGNGRLYLDMAEPDQKKAFERNKLLGLIVQRVQEGEK